MSKIKICEYCRQESCDGKLWRTKPVKIYGEQGEHVITVCTSNTYFINGKRMTKYIMGHGNSWDEPVFPIDNEK